jgi:hypothetical protein
MRESIVIIVLILSLPTRIFGQSEIKEKADSLRFLAEQISHGVYVHDIYLQTFPDSFSEMKLIFGYTEDPDSQEFFKGYLYDDAYNHMMNILLTLDQHVELDYYYEKLVNASIGGKWQADGINFFLGVVINKLVSRPQLFLDTLCEKTQNEIDSFWDFYFDGPNGNQRFSGLNEKVEGYPKIIKSIERFKK